KKMFSVFQESGIFTAGITTCFSHSLLSLMLFRSKYPLAIMDKLLSMPSPNGSCAYDIGCTFATTLQYSSLGPKATALNLKMMVGSFHGHAHNWKCQLNWHPLYIPGTGHTEGEGCEHIFSSSNNL
ncbi:hypothetical protein BU15DRAFT_20676, partial [Melanogaster broomeanus]